MSKKAKIVIASLVSLVAVGVIVAVSVLGWLFSFSYKKDPVEKATSIELPENGILRVLQLTDLHLTRHHFNKRDKETLKWVKEAVEYAGADVVAVTGDAVGSLFPFRQRDKAVIALAEIFEEAEVYWMYTFGNHDGEWAYEYNDVVWNKENPDKGKEEILEILKGYKYSLMVDGGTDGVGNYVVDVKDKDGNVVFGLVNMDTHGKLYDENGKDIGYKGVTAGQVEWYGQQIDALCERAGKPVKSAMFIHVPLYEYTDALRNYEFTGVFETAALEKKCYAPNENIGFYDKIVEKGSTNFVTAGHDHDYNWLIKYEGEDHKNSGFPVYFSYGRCSGVNAWGRRVQAGATVIDINVNAERLEDMYHVSVIYPSFHTDVWEGWEYGWEV